MREVRGVQARFDPPPNAVRYTKSSGVCVSNLTEEEGILATSGTVVLVYKVFTRSQIGNSGFTRVVRGIGEQVCLCIEPILLGRVGCCNMVGELWCTAPVVRGCVEGS
jgi:hypothetical protein